ncbi:SH3 domain-containing protein [Blastomonas aquatica]|uniref:SH3b domain-containing protein n=1 Tax=Blastomonas aquatica TaxID=1510276 RepID=A0ABQ1JL61_9SPHN|nr:SH3 domain-containing protein [Blastomonas aquatica]GGB71840.1 hypothetical protein GCM10010833_28790 [Blastomonas aquatica]
MTGFGKAFFAWFAAIALITTPTVILAQQSGSLSEAIAQREQQSQQGAPQKKKGGILGDVLTVVVGVGSAALCGAFDRNNGQTQRTACLALGAVAGLGVAELNKSISKRINEKEQAELLSAAGDSLSDGKPRSLAFAETGASASVTPTGTLVFEDAKVTMFYDSVALQSRERVEVIAQPYLTTSKVNVRGGPSTSAKVVRTFQPNSAVHVVGKVPNEEWYMVSERVTDGENQALMVVGYVSADMVEPADDNFVLPALKAPETVSSAEFDVALRCNEITYQLRDSKGKLVSDKSKNCIGPEGQLMSA